VIFHASGTTGFGVFEAARAAGKLAIGVDSDQADSAPGFILTSMVKDVDVAVFETIRAVKDGTFQAGVRTFGLRENGVRLVRDAGNAQWITPAVGAQLDALADSITAGAIRVPER
jgi:basic membrane protein A